MARKPAPAEHRARVDALVRELGETKASAHLGLSVNTINRILGCRPCNEGTLAQLRERFRAADASEAA